jgi:hypothetical protein
MHHLARHAVACFLTRGDLVSDPRPALAITLLPAPRSSVPLSRHAPCLTVSRICPACCRSWGFCSSSGRDSASLVLPASASLLSPPGAACCGGADLRGRVQFVYWEKGRDVFDRLLIDGDWSINNGNWLWLSCSAFFSQARAPPRHLVGDHHASEERAHSNNIVSAVKLGVFLRSRRCNRHGGPQHGCRNAVGKSTCKLVLTLLSVPAHGTACSIAPLMLSNLAGMRSSKGRSARRPLSLL